MLSPLIIPCIFRILLAVGVPPWDMESASVRRVLAVTPPARSGGRLAVRIAGAHSARSGDPSLVRSRARLIMVADQ
jgi:hypothetical protein